MYISNKRSKEANEFEKITWESRSKDKYMKKDQLFEFLEERKIDNNKEYILPNIDFKDKVSKEIIFGREVFKISKPNLNSKKAVIYMHGGGYVNKANIHHFVLAKNIIEAVDVDFIIPLYPLAPNVSFRESYIFFEKLYNFVSEKYESIVLMGDSAGGGFCYGFLKYIEEKGLQKYPEKIITFSPWIDISMSNDDIDKYEAKDPMLSRYGLSEIAKIWADGESVFDEKVSPIYAKNMSIFKNSYIFVGTREIFYPDIIKFIEKLKKENINVESYVYEDMNHIFPVVSDLPEAIEAQNIVKQILISE